MRFEWDPEKARRNLVKHGVDFDEAVDVWKDPMCAIFPDRFEDGEQRWHAVGVVGSVTLLLVVHVYPDEDDVDRVRIIGARRATSHERRRYEQKGA